MTARPILIFGLGRSGTTWVQEVFRYAGCRVLGEPFNSQLPVRHGTADHGMPRRKNDESPAEFIHRTAEAVAPKRLVYKILVGVHRHLSFHCLNGCVEISEPIALLRHPTACYVSACQGEQSTVFNLLHHEINQRAALAAYQPPVIEAVRQRVQRWMVAGQWLLAYVDRYPGILVIRYAAIAVEPDATWKLLCERFDLPPTDPAKLPPKLNSFDIPSRVSNWDEISDLVSDSPNDLPLI